MTCADLYHFLTSLWTTPHERDARRAAGGGAAQIRRGQGGAEAEEEAGVRRCSFTRTGIAPGPTTLGLFRLGSARLGSPRLGPQNYCLVEMAIPSRFPDERDWTVGSDPA